MEGGMGGGQEGGSSREERERGRREEGGEQEIKSVSFEHKASGHMESWYIISLSPCRLLPSSQPLLHTVTKAGDRRSLGTRLTVCCTDREVQEESLFLTHFNYHSFLCIIEHVESNKHHGRIVC